MAETEEQPNVEKKSQLEETRTLSAGQKVTETPKTNDEVKETPKPPQIPTLVRRQFIPSPVYTPSFNYTDWAFFTGLVLLTVASIGTRLYRLDEPHHVA